jgi:hypothetical protein
LAANRYSASSQPKLTASPHKPSKRPLRHSSLPLKLRSHRRAKRILSGLNSQNSFNDNNYRPKQPTNTYTPPATQQIAAAPTANQSTQRTTTRDTTAKWIKSWNGGSNYLAEWVAVNNRIDSSSVCANHRRGSIDYRECRKAAKQHYHEECKTWRARYDNDRKERNDRNDRMKQRYCSAASSFSLMG